LSAAEGHRAMPAFLISLREGVQSPEGDTRSLIAERVSQRWADSRQIDGSNWVVECSGPADDIRDQLADLLREDDALVVIGAGSEAAWAGLGSADADWLAELLSD
jgi:hypothetical protein